MSKMSDAKARKVTDGGHTISVASRYGKGGKAKPSNNKKKHRGRISDRDASYGNIMQY